MPEFYQVHPREKLFAARRWVRHLPVARSPRSNHQVDLAERPRDSNFQGQQPRPGRLHSMTPVSRQTVRWEFALRPQDKLVSCKKFYFPGMLICCSLNSTTNFSLSIQPKQPRHETKLKFVVHSRC